MLKLARKTICYKSPFFDELQKLQLLLFYTVGARFIFRFIFHFFKTILLLEEHSFL
jgi:hypothetical protein